MGNELVPFEKFAIAQFDQSELLETIQANVGGEQITERQLERVKMPSGGSVTWEVPTLEGTASLKEIAGVVVYSKLTRAYWQTSYDDGGGADIPDCASNDSQQAFPPNADFTPPADTHPDGGFACATCSLAKFGSATDKAGNPTKGQACQQRRLLFILTENDFLPIVVSLSPTSLTPASDYMLRLTRAGKPYWKVQTGITLDKYTDPKPHARAVFRKVADLDAEGVERVKAYRNALIPVFTTVQDAYRQTDDD